MPAVSMTVNGKAVSADASPDTLLTTALKDGEPITSVKFPIPQAACCMKFVNPASRFPLVGVFVARIRDGVVVP